jgi:hypothetical protein
MEKKYPLYSHGISSGRLGKGAHAAGGIPGKVKKWKSVLSWASLLFVAVISRQMLEAVEDEAD